jgi:sulfiredoxin
MMRREKFAIANIYVPIKRRATLKPETVQQIAQSMLEVGQKAPIQVRRDGDHLVLAHGLHRLEACKALGEETIYGYLVQAEKHQSAEPQPNVETSPPTNRSVTRRYAVETAVRKDKAMRRWQELVDNLLTDLETETPGADDFRVNIDLKIWKAEQTVSYAVPMTPYETTVRRVHNFQRELVSYDRIAHQIS